MCSNCLLICTDDYSPEVFTTELRAKANAIVQVVHYSISLIITQCSPIALAEVGWKYYVRFPDICISIDSNCCLDSLCLDKRILRCYFLFCVPRNSRYESPHDTLVIMLTHLGKSLEEIDEIFGDVKIVHEEDVRFSEKSGVEAIESRDNRIV